MNIDEMPAGRELDALVAERVMGLPVVWSEPPYVKFPYTSKPEGRFPYLKGNVGGCEYDWADCPRYSTDIAAAWQVVEHLRRTIDPEELTFNLETTEGGRWSCFLLIGEVGGFRYTDKAPLAICRAALAALKTCGVE